MDSKQAIVLFLFFAFALNIILCQDELLPPYNLFVSSVTATSVTLGWVPYNLTDGYVITTDNRFGKIVNQKIFKNGEITNIAVISDLQVFSRYTFRIRTLRDTSFSREISIKASTLPQPTGISAIQTKGKGEVTFNITSDVTIYLPYAFCLELSQNNELVFRVLSRKNEIIVSGLSDGTYTPRVTATRNNYKGEAHTGSEFKVFGVTAKAKVDEPQNLYAYVRGDAIMLVWTAASSGLGYQVTIHSDPVRYYVHTLRNNFFEFNYLEPCTNYSFTVRTTSEGSLLSNEKTLTNITTKGPSVFLTGYEETVPVSEKVTFYWNPMKFENCDFIFDMRFTNDRGEIYRTHALYWDSYYSMYSLAPGKYELSIATSKSQILGKADVKHFIKAAWPTKIVPPPYNFNVLSVTETSVRLGWVSPDWGTGYVIRTTDQSGKQVGRNSIIAGLETQSFVITDLENSPIYTFTIRTVNGNTFSHGISIQASTLPTPTYIGIVLHKSIVMFLITSEEKNYKPYKFLLELIKNNESFLQVKYSINKIIVSGLSPGIYTPIVTATRNNYKGEAHTGSQFRFWGLPANAKVDAPTKLKSDLHDDYVSLTWTAATIGVGYLVTVGLHRVPYYLEGLYSCSFDTEPLEMCTEYLLTVKTVGQEFTLSEEITTKFKKGGPLVTLTGVEETDPASGKVTLYWNPIKPTQICNWIYIISVWKKKGLFYRACASATVSSYELYSVAEDVYTWRVNTEFGVMSSHREYKTFRKAAWPTKKSGLNPLKLEVLHISATTISISWRTSTDYVGYQYTLDHKDPKFILNGYYVSGIKIMGLKRATQYTITVSSLTESSVSKGSDINVETFK